MNDLKDADARATLELALDALSEGRDLFDDLVAKENNAALLKAIADLSRPELQRCALECVVRARYGVLREAR